MATGTVPTVAMTVGTEGEITVLTVHGDPDHGSAGDQLDHGRLVAHALDLTVKRRADPLKTIGGHQAGATSVTSSHWLCRSSAASTS